jgi:hypothetical protein
MRENFFVFGEKTVVVLGFVAKRLIYEMSNSHLCMLCD